MIAPMTADVKSLGVGPRVYECPLLGGAHQRRALRSQRALLPTSKAVSPCFAATWQNIVRWAERFEHLHRYGLN